MVRVVPCTPEHLMAVDIPMTETERTLRTRSAVHGRDVLEHSARALLSGDHVLACFGVVMFWPGVAHAWAMISEEARKYPISLTRCVSREIEQFEKRWSIRRLEAAVVIDDERAARWLKVLGFNLERGVVRNYGMCGMGDYAMYARIN